MGQRFADWMQKVVLGLATSTVALAPAISSAGEAHRNKEEALQSQITEARRLLKDRFRTVGAQVLRMFGFRGKVCWPLVHSSREDSTDEQSCLL